MNKAERTASIQEAVDRAKKQAKEEETPVRQERIWCRENWKYFEKYAVPADALVLNIDNRRFSAERKLMEEKLGHSLDPENNPDDEISVMSILLDTGLNVEGAVVKGNPTKDYTALKNDWKKRGQESPFWIRPDGTVRNGNRRLAMLKRMREEEGIEGTRFVDAIVLDPAQISEQELFEMEQREQLTENFKVNYTDINLLITLREAAEVQRIDWNDPGDIERVAGELQEFVRGDKTYAAVQLRAIKYMDDYLAYNNTPGQYQLLIGMIERFRDVGKNMAKMLEDYPDDAADMLQLQFGGINAGMKHGHIRSIGKMFREDREAYQRVKERVFKIENESTKPAKLEAPDLSTVVEDDDDANAEPAPLVADYPVEPVKSALLDAIDGFESQNLEVARKLARAASMLGPVREDLIVEALKGPEAREVREMVMQIIRWAEKAKTLITN